MSELEIEVKYHIKDKQAARRKILALGAASKGAVFEKNIRFDDDAGTLGKTGRLLRLRHDGKATLTFKEARQEGESDCKVHLEIETRVDDFDATFRILESLGFYARQVYEKEREEFVLDDAHICLDTMPYGDFIEIEAGRRKIRELSEMLGLRWEERIVANYLEIFDAIRQGAGLPFNDVTFENFRAVSIDAEKFVSKFKAG